MSQSIDSGSEGGYASWEEESLPPLANMTGRGYLPHMVKVKLEDFRTEMLQKIESVDYEMTADADNPLFGIKVKNIGLNIACRAYWYGNKVIEEYLVTVRRVRNVGEPLCKELDEIREKLMEFKIWLPERQ